MNEQIWQEAEKLAARPYSISYEIDTLTNDQHIILLRHPELPAVKAQGHDLEEANRNLDEARVDYIYSLLDDGLPVPPPRTSTVTSSPSKGHVWNINAAASHESIESEIETTLDDHKIVAGLSFGGDLVKQG